MELSPGRIRILDENTVHRIAAGEVVDRPASVLKELIENSIDAGASSIKIQLLNGGMDLIEIEDDGEGMLREDLALCLKRHATSKISNEDDLDHIETLGFRGEALAAVSSVARVQIETCARDQSEAWVLEHDQTQTKITPCSRLSGTKVSIKDLFYNTPARRKFLKSPGSEASACVQILWSLALSHPGVAFDWYVVDAKGEVKDHERLPKQSARDRFLYSLKSDAELVEVYSKKPCEGVESITILAARAPISFRSQNNVHLFVNGRYVTDKRLSYALREAYTGLIEMGAFPAVWISLDVNPSVIDVNIHPQKKELRWPKGFSLGSLVYKALRPHLDVRGSGTRYLPQNKTTLNAPRLTSLEFSNLQNFFQPADTAQKLHVTTNDSVSEWPIEGRRAVPLPTKSAAIPPFRFAELTVVGEVGASWLVLESSQGLVLVDQHAAHERINYEKILGESDLLRPKPLLFPLKIVLPLAVVDYRDEIAELLETFAFECSDLDACKDGEIELLALPESDRKISWEELLQDLFERIDRSDSLEALKLQIESKIAASLACHGSIRRGQRLHQEQIKVLMQDLDRVDWGAFCPHGRPVWILMSHQQIEDLFHR